MLPNRVRIENRAPILPATSSVPQRQATSHALRHGTFVTPFEYILAFAAVILGLAVSELAMGVHRLLSARTEVRWDWLAPLAAVVVLLKIITQWWAWYSAQALPGGLRFEMFGAVIVGGFLLFLLAATPLPESAAPGESVDLAAHFEHVRRRFWLLFAAHWVVATGVSEWVQVAMLGAHLSPASPAFLIAPAALAMAFVRWRWAQGGALLVLLGLYVMQYFGRQLVGR